ncbi:DUF4437 domain-containing protein [Corallococcus sp. CA053C]|uniref:DUF4437 domain-containing protein n=1 Tax=Corallococcus sp. CA053C TaxID=2316732 RepID=UPI000EA31AF6|nr:DUF4437 domain-containing protein [Corallococcus sp. CA053C]RKH06591.1 DUF4437 domain-containing protein [Corallococcus sp. CA053C]
MKTFARLTAALVVVSAFSLAAAKGKAEAAAYQQTAYDKLTWTEMMPGGPAVHVLWGDMKKGPYALLMKFPAGFDSGPHTHSADYHGVLVKGRMTNSSEGIAPSGPVEAGSTWDQPGKTVHANKCAPESECVMLIAQDKAFDFAPAKAK